MRCGGYGLLYLSWRGSSAFFAGLFGGVSEDVGGRGHVRKQAVFRTGVSDEMTVVVGFWKKGELRTVSPSI